MFRSDPQILRPPRGGVEPEGVEETPEETEFYTALGGLLNRSRPPAARTAGFAASVLAAHVADVAATGDAASRAEAFEALLTLRDEVEELVKSLEEMRLDGDARAAE